MAIKLTNEDTDFAICNYVIDTEEDRNDLPAGYRTGVGSMAYCISTGKVYILGSNGWTDYMTCNCGSGSGSGSGTGADGKSAYELAVENGFEGTEQEWLDSLKAKSPEIGENGNWFIDGEDTGVPAADGECGCESVEDDLVRGVFDYISQEEQNKQ